MLGFLSAAMTMVMIDATVLNVGVPQLAADIGAFPADIQWFNAAYALVFAALLITFGQAADRVGYRRMFVLGAGVFVLASLVVAFSPAAPVVIVGRALQGVGGAMLVPATLSLVNSHFFGRERGAAFAIWGVVIGVIAALGPIVGGLVIEVASWRWAFAINVPIAAAAIIGVLITTTAQQRPDGPRAEYDIAGAALSAVAVGGLVFALIEGPVYGWGITEAETGIGPVTWPAGVPSPVLAAVVAAVAAGLLFWRREVRRSRAGHTVVLDLTLFRVPSFAVGTVVGLVIMFGEFGMILTLPLFLQNVIGYNAFQAGATVASITVGGLLGASTSARFVGWKGTATTVRWGVLAQVVAMVGIASAYAPTASAWDFAPWLFLFGVGVGLTNAQLLNMVLADVPVRQSGQASATQSTSRQIGIALGVAVIGAVLWTSLDRELDAQLADPGPVEAAISESSGAAINSPDVDPADRLDIKFDAETQAQAQEAFSNAVARATYVGAGFVALAFLAMAPIRSGARRAPIPQPAVPAPAGSRRPTDGEAAEASGE